MDVVLHFHKARKGVAKTRGSSCLTDPDGDISCISSVQGADFRCIRQEKDVLLNFSLSLSTVEQVCSVVVTPWAVAVQMQLLRSISRKKICGKKVILPFISSILCDALLFRVCQTRCDKKTIGFLVVCI